MAQRKSAESVADVMLETTDLAQRLTPLSPRTLERWRTTGDGPPYVKVGHRVLYRQSAVERWLDAQTRTHTNDAGEKRRPVSRRKAR